MDIFNCWIVEVEFSTFFNCSTSSKKEQFRSNSGGLSIAYHTYNDTVYFNSSLRPRVSVTDSVFVGNQAILPGGNIQQINQALNNHIYLGRGGGFGLFLDEYIVNIDANIERCQFMKNYAESFGGGLYLYIDGSRTHHNFTVKNCIFSQNAAYSNSFGGGLQVALLIRNVYSEPSRVYVVGCNFTENAAHFGGGLSIVQVYSQGSGNWIHLRNSRFEGNRASDVGGAVMFASQLYVQNRNTPYFYEVCDK